MIPITNVHPHCGAVPEVSGNEKSSELCSHTCPNVCKYQLLHKDSTGPDNKLNKPVAANEICFFSAVMTNQICELTH